MSNRAMSKMRLCPLLVCTVVLSGCGSWFKGTCAKPGDFASVVDNPPLKVPLGPPLLVFPNSVMNGGSPSDVLEMSYSTLTPSS